MKAVFAVEGRFYCIHQSYVYFSSLLEKGGVQRLVYITRSRAKFSPKVVKFAASVNIPSTSAIQTC